jgi:hypothetical protein
LNLNEISVIDHHVPKLVAVATDNDGSANERKKNANISPLGGATFTFFLLLTNPDQSIVHRPSASFPPAPSPSLTTSFANE